MRHKIFLLTILAISFALNLNSQTSPCGQDTFRAFDFWIGDWRVELPNGGFAGNSKIQVILDSCVILENWQGGSSYKGKSFNHYNTESAMWRQKWLDNFGGSLEFEGEVKNDTAMYFATTKNPKTGVKSFHKMMIAKVTDDEVHQLWKQSTDQEEWQVLFDGKYIRIKDPAIKQINMVYDSFSHAYATFDSELIGSLYAEDAMYLEGKGGITYGRDKIMSGFKQAFEGTKKRSETMEIKFDIKDRQISGDLAADIGVYRLRYLNAEGVEKLVSAGKFSTVLKKQKDGKWVFISDSYNTAPLSEFNSKE